jgi:RNA recognition motif-containing protein
MIQNHNTAELAEQRLQRKPKKLEKSCSIYVGQIPSNLTPAQLKARFGQFGKILSMSKIKTHKGKSSGFCYIEFSQESSANRVLEYGEVSVKGVNLVCKKMVKKKKVLEDENIRDKRRAFCDTIPSQLSSEMKKELRKVLRGFGRIKNVYFAKKKKKEDDGLMVAHITFKSEEDVKNALDREVFFRGHTLRIKVFRRHLFKKKKSKEDNRKNNLFQFEPQVKTNPISKMRINKNLRAFNSQNPPLRTNQGGEGFLSGGLKKKTHISQFFESTMEAVLNLSKYLIHCEDNIRMNHPCYKNSLVYNYHQAKEHKFSTLFHYNNRKRAEIVFTSHFDSRGNQNQLG